eukprot:GFYU01029234.1.p1 GENE.GFYU01029234.1~~GFYU01029234.1.p1  ORF type:complete len:386 (-),score=99.45 GFYU01029234.1:577-1626(-)
MFNHGILQTGLDAEFHDMNQCLPVSDLPQDTNLFSPGTPKVSLDIEAFMKDLWSPNRSPLAMLKSPSPMRAATLLRSAKKMTPGFASPPSILRKRKATVSPDTQRKSAQHILPNHATAPFASPMTPLRAGTFGVDSSVPDDGTHPINAFSAFGMSPGVGLLGQSRSIFSPEAKLLNPLQELFQDDVTAPVVATMPIAATTSMAPATTTTATTAVPSSQPFPAANLSAAMDAVAAGNPLGVASHNTTHSMYPRIASANSMPFPTSTVVSTTKTTSTTVPTTQASTNANALNIQASAPTGPVKQELPPQPVLPVPPSSLPQATIPAPERPALSDQQQAMMATSYRNLKALR